jgi:hypothetical protein
MRQVRTRKPVGRILVIALSAAAAVVGPATAGSAIVRPGMGGLAVARPAGAGPASTKGASALLYDYEFAGTTGTVANAAPKGPGVPLTMQGTWSDVPGGVDFSGNTTGDSSVAFGKPTSGYSIYEPPTKAVGFGARILYYRPATGRCFGDTPNITQIGRFTGTPSPTQAKIQLSSCHASKRHVVIECRFAGLLTTTKKDHPVVSTLPLVNNREYNVSCVKSPDQAGSATITLTVTTVSTGQTVTNTFNVGAIGTMRSRAYISAGNKYPLPPPAQNTDQFNGHMIRTVYCAGTTADVTSCLQTYLPAN